MASVFETRTRELQSDLRETGSACVILPPGPNLYYLTGFWESPMERHFLLFVPTEGHPTILAPDLYRQVLTESVWVEDVRTYSDGDDPLDEIRAIATKRGFEDERLLLDPRMWTRFSLELRSLFPDATFGLAAEIMARHRRRKDETELAAIRTASTVADDVMELLRDRASSVVGRTEAELADWIGEECRDRGEELAFDVVVASGPNGAHPHHHPGPREIQSGDPVVIDFGVRVDHYPSDVTRTFVFGGGPPAEFESAFAAVSAAQTEAIEAIEPGRTAESIDAIAREVLESHGYGEAFVHRTGHGIGLDVHEDPYIVEGNTETLAPGMVFSVEPGVYLDGAFGIRIEDLVAVTESGAEVLNSTPRDWNVLSENHSRERSAHERERTGH